MNSVKNVNLKSLLNLTFLYWTKSTYNHKLVQWLITKIIIFQISRKISFTKHTTLRIYEQPAEIGIFKQLLERIDVPAEKVGSDRRTRIKWIVSLNLSKKINRIDSSESIQFCRAYYIYSNMITVIPWILEKSFFLVN